MRPIYSLANPQLSHPGRKAALHSITHLMAIGDSSGIPPAEMSVSKYASDAATPRTVDEVTVELARRHKREASAALHDTTIGTPTFGPDA